ncbi:Uu.00g051980.m01.CDS01 [Anthostomella pinea]|uniref:Uu.00g051980.m01.CDS01 n=1 Tax=Anthostomella pinea TaxID=933095 RepID=A0AAI8YPC8_9PEZI|nr:Uu.00g051980.m01.CDS01 [Anthostomella pinea]
MPPSDEFKEAVRVGDGQRIRTLCSLGKVDAAAATEALKSLKHPADVLRALLEHGADANQVPLHVLRRCHDLETFKLLAEYGLDIKSKDHEILEDLVGQRYILDFLLDKGADISKPSNRTSGRTKLRGGERDHTLGVLNNAAALGDAALFDHLVSRGADPSKSIALHHAARCQDAAKTTAMIAHLVDRHHFDVNASDGCGGLRDFFGDVPDIGSPLNFAVVFKNLAAVEALLERGADTEGKLAVAGGGASGAAADQDQEDGHRRYPVATAIGDGYTFRGFVEALRPLLEAGADATVGLRCAVDRNNLDAARLLLDFGGDPKLVKEMDAQRVEESGDPDGYAGMSREMSQLLEKRE